MTIRSQSYRPDSTAPDDADVTLPGNKKPDLQSEWRLQAKCVKLIRKRMRIDPDLRFIASMAENARTPARAAMAKMMGLTSGVADIILLRRHDDHFTVAWVELKRLGKPLSDAQQDWADWWGTLIRCYRVDSVEAFAAILAGF